MATLTAASHIWLDNKGHAWIDDTNIKVIEVALDHLAYGWSAETIQEQFPAFSLTQIYAALAYYYDHREVFDEQIVASCRSAEWLAAAGHNSPLRQRLRSLGKL